MEFCLLSEKEFAKFEKRNKYGNFFQSVERAKLREKMGYHTYLTGMKDKGEIQGVGLIVEKDGEAWVQLGPILNWSDKRMARRFVKGIVDFSKEKKFLELEIYPPVLMSVRDADGNVLEKYNQKWMFTMMSELGFRHTGMTVEPNMKALRWMFVKNLRGYKTLDEAVASFNKPTRNKWRKTQREVEIYTLQDKSELKEWVKPLQDSNKRNHAKTRQMEYFQDLWDIFGDKVEFLEARRKDTGEVVASQVQVWHANELVSFLAGVTEKYKKYNGVTAIKGWQIKECLERKVTRLNLYGVPGKFDEDNPLLMAKRGLNGVVEEYVGGWAMTLRPVGYFAMRVKRKMKSMM